ncbi:MAG: hypothetical protein Ctma_1150 [Catillopecten margaritatus gill symbiont]|uniref:NYN domain-containing protein n=1 Tax=Catillopecten margaritatus gill symbiont TaxID=3083288 RepID=A0AAU6PHB1_9GAMM
MSKKKVIVFIDGFNLYHAIGNLNSHYNAQKRKNQPITHPNKNYLKWVDLYKLSQLFVKKDEMLVDVFYFTAYAKWKNKVTVGSNSSPVDRHQDYVKALELNKVKTVFGKFKDKTVFCRKCKQTFTGHEEKETDVNLSIKAVDLAHKNKFDKAIVISADSDLTPPARLITELGKEVQFLIPPTYKHVTKEIKKSFDYSAIKEKHLATSLLPEKISQGKIKIQMSHLYKRSFVK